MQRGFSQADLSLIRCCAHAVSSWIDNFCSIYAISSHSLPLLTSSLPFTLSSTQCGTRITNDAGIGTLQDHGCDLSDHSALTFTHNTQPTTTSTSKSIKKTSSWWTDNEIMLLLNYVESNCTLTTARGLTLKKSEFNKACATVKSKDATQCHYKWGQVCVFQVIIIYYLHYLSELYVVMLNIQSNLAVGQEVW